MHCGLLAGEFSEFLCFKQNLHVLSILFVFSIFHFLSQCTVDYQRASSVNLLASSQTCPFHFLFVFAMLCLIFNALWITVGGEFSELSCLSQTWMCC